MAYRKRHGGKIKGANNGTAKPGDPPQQPIQKYPLTRGLPAKAVPLSGETSGYGVGQYAGPSSAKIGEVESDMAQELRNAGDDGENVLDSLIHEGYADRTGANIPEDVASDFQTRKIDTNANVPVAHGMKNPNASPIKFAAGLDKTEGEPVRKPGT